MSNTPEAQLSAAREAFLMRKWYHVVGNYRVQFRQLEMHRKQRQKNESWVQELSNTLRDSPDRGQYPIEVILRHDEAWNPEDSEMKDTEQEVPWAPARTKFLCFSGLHRVEAWKLAYAHDESTWWWPAVVYGSGDGIPLLLH